MITVYGIANCDSVKKTRRFLEAAGIDYSFHDFRKDGIDQELINSFLKRVSLDQLINKRSSSWRSLNEAEREALQYNCAILIKQPTLIKRPVIVTESDIIVGFKQASMELLA